MRFIGLKVLLANFCGMVECIIKVTTSFLGFVNILGINQLILSFSSTHVLPLCWRIPFFWAWKQLSQLHFIQSSSLRSWRNVLRSGNPRMIQYLNYWNFTPSAVMRSSGSIANIFPIRWCACLRREISCLG